MAVLAEAEWMRHVFPGEFIRHNIYQSHRSIGCFGKGVKGVKEAKILTAGPVRGVTVRGETPVCPEAELG